MGFRAGQDRNLFMQTEKVRLQIHYRNGCCYPVEYICHAVKNEVFDVYEIENFVTAKFIEFCMQQILCICLPSKNNRFFG